LNKNYEIKVGLSNKEFIFIRNLLLKNKEFSYTEETQKDIYYKVKTGRLKLRIINEVKSNLIFYERKELIKKRVSNYLISANSDKNEITELDKILRKQFEVLVTVDKRREIFIRENIRVHIDTVKSLGNFLEIEIIFTSLIKAKEQMKEITEFLKLKEKEFIKVSYSDILINKNKCQHKNRIPRNI